MNTQHDHAQFMGNLVGGILAILLFGLVFIVLKNVNDSAVCTLYEYKSIEVHLTPEQQAKVGAENNFFILPEGVKLPVNSTNVYTKVAC